MKLTKALGKSSLIKDSPTNYTEASYPDENGGFGLGTWDIYTMKVFYKDIPEEEQDNEAGEDYYPVGGEGVQIYHRFTKEQCENILEHLKSLEIKEIDYEGKKVEVALNLSECYEALFIEWYQRLIDLFSDFNDLPVYYWAD